AVARIQHHDRPGAADHRLLGHFLHAAIDRGDDLGPRIGLLAAHHLHRAPHGVDLDALAAVAPPEIVVQQPLEAGLADHVAPPVAALLHLLVADLAHVPQEVSREGAVGIHALRL